jgi:hypothetical protein
MQRVLRRGILQAKLIVNQPGDVFEQEADRVAEAVVNGGAVSLGAPTAESGTAKAKGACACGGTCDDCQRKVEVVQRPTTGSADVPATAPRIVHEVFQSTGQPLAPGIRNEMEPSFGADFGEVRVHSNSRAAESARAVKALAYTFGRNIVFGDGQFTPQTAAGKLLLAHELTHVLQQSRPPSSGIRFLQRAPETGKVKGGENKGKKETAKKKEAECDPAEGTLAEVRSIPETTAGVLGVTKPEDLTFKFVPLFKKGTCSAEVTEASLSFRHFVAVKAGTYKTGTMKPTSGNCQGKAVTTYLTISPQLADRIKQAEIEHCRDAHQAFDLTFGKFNKAARDMKVGFPAKDQSDCNLKASSRALKATGVDSAKWIPVAVCLFGKSQKRDQNGWHSVESGNPVYSKDCKSAAYTPDATTTLKEVGKHSSEDLVKGCGE